MISLDEIKNQLNITIIAIQQDPDFLTDDALQKYVKKHKDYLNILTTENDLAKIMKTYGNISAITYRAYLETSSNWGKDCLLEIDTLSKMSNELYLLLRNKNNE